MRAGLAVWLGLLLCTPLLDLTIASEDDETGYRRPQQAAPKASPVSPPDSITPPPAPS